MQTDPHLEARIELIDDEQEKSLEIEALMASVQGQIEQYVQSGAPVPPDDVEALVAFLATAPTAPPAR